jgi:hypothetical protein
VKLAVVVYGVPSISDLSILDCTISMLYPPDDWSSVYFVRCECDCVGVGDDVVEECAYGVVYDIPFF